jgi:23S rRNA (adenine2503-C2)-methyltransferase
MDNKIDIKSLKINELKELVESLGEKAFRAKQIYEWLHKKQVNTFLEMTNISKNLVDKLDEKCIINEFKIEDCLSSKDGTKKLLFRLYDNQVIESVFMKYKHGNSVCISSQAGCKMGCKFCASTIGGLKRNLTPSEMLEQIYNIEKYTEEKVSNVVIMGTGEPFDNYDNVMTFLKIITSKEGRNIGQRNITISTCGLVDRIIDFAREKTQINLAISLHAPNDSIRKKIMPIVNKYSYSELINSCKEYIRITNRRITFEYSLINGVNDSKENAKELAKNLKGMLCHVNLIPVNEVKEKSYIRSNEENIHIFKSILENNNINVTIRRSLGKDIDAACGQLRRKYMDETM